MITIYDLVEAVRATLGQAQGVLQAQANEGMTEGIGDLPLLQVYPQSGEADNRAATDRTTFRGGARQEQVVLAVDLFARMRSDLGEDMAALTQGLDAVRRVLVAQHTKPFFGLDGPQAFSWSWQRVSITYGQPEQKYAGVRFTLVFMVPS